MLKTFISIIIMLVILFASSGCSPSATTNSHNQSNSLVSNETNKQIQFKDLVTNKNYKVNDQIEIGNSTDIVVKQDVWQSPIYWRSNVNILGADSQGNIITFNIENSNVESIDSDQKLSVLINLTEGRPNHVFAIKKFGDIIAWSECPHGNVDPASDTTRGANWGLYYTDLKTKKITKIDEYKGVTVPEGTQYSYLAPNQVFIAPDHISYITFDYNPEGKVTSVIKLYTISTQKLEVLDYLNEDLTKYAFGYPRVSGDKVVWCKALVNPDGTYTGCSYLYDIKTKTRSKLVTDENIINPIISRNYIFAQGEPNKTFYDSEVCIYDIDKNQWVYKINNGLFTV